MISDDEVEYDDQDEEEEPVTRASSSRRRAAAPSLKKQKGKAAVKPAPKGKKGTPRGCKCFAN